MRLEQDLYRPAGDLRADLVYLRTVAVNAASGIGKEVLVHLRKMKRKCRLATGTRNAGDGIDDYTFKLY